MRFKAGDVVKLYPIEDSSESWLSPDGTYQLWVFEDGKTSHTEKFLPNTLGIVLDVAKTRSHSTVIEMLLDDGRRLWVSSWNWVRTTSLAP